MPSDPVSSAKAHQPHHHQQPPPPQDPEDNHRRLCECLSPAELQINKASCFCHACYSGHIRGRIYYNPHESYVMCLKTGNRIYLCETCFSPAELQIDGVLCFCRECYSEHIRELRYYDPYERDVMCLETGNRIVIHIVKPVDPIDSDENW
jgi:hypothetical protein